jgi:hypothetical protein
MPATPDNSDGYWENLMFVRLNERLLHASGGTWFAPPVILRPTPEITSDAKALLATFDGREPWGWKDPRNAVTLPFWTSLLPTLKVVVCVRHPAETVSSLAASELIPRTSRFYWAVTRRDSPIALRDGASRLPARLWGAARASLSMEKRRALVHEVGLEAWRFYNTRVLEDISVANRLVTHYEAILTHPRRELERILPFVGIQVPPAVIDDAVSVVSPRLRHQQADAASLPDATRALYARLTAEASA